jgi:hypothetical protein
MEINWKLALHALILAALLTGCGHSDDYKIVSFSEDPSVSSGRDPILGHKFVLVHNKVRLVAHCWIPEHHIADTSCLTLKSMVGETVRLEYWGDQRDVLVYEPNGPKAEPMEMLRVASASSE